LVDVVLRPSEHAAPPTTAVPPALPSTAKSSTLIRPVLPAPSDTTSNNIGVKAVVEISQAAIADQVVDITDDLARGRSLWDTAYDALKKEGPDRIAAYEDLLSRVPTRGKLHPVLDCFPTAD
jgi:hypothetical protein